MRVIDLIGQKYGRLTVISFNGKNKRNKALWECVCDCGKNRIVLGESLKSGNTISCGCASKYIDNTSTINHLYNNYKIRAKISKMDFFLSDQFKTLISNNCYYCGSEPKQIHKPKGYYKELIYNGIDRVHNKYGYVLENVVSCCKNCNLMKLTLTQSDFLNHIGKIQQWQEKKMQLEIERNRD